ncbi:hypothetical protein QR680_006727 [Steinernema hermaphroditum]|uniref:PCI domain-containing protein n=1 Tax=Steinernema hermaphroditum TaxID=289476 RepID=A0AA39HXX1_9BILA|nr:hypothetical protein QR680_006727 [Steinernema hermaphroditum]
MTSTKLPAQAVLSMTSVQELVCKPIDENDEVEVKSREDAIMCLGKRLSRERNTEELKKLISVTRPFIVGMGKAKAAKLVRSLVDLALVINQDGQMKVELCKECIEWAAAQKRVFLRQTLEARLVRLYNDIGKYPDALNLAQRLIRELRKLDNKDVLMEVQLEESKSGFMLKNLMRARTSLVNAKTTASGVYLQPKFQAALNMQSGIIHASGEKDFKTAYSYFYEAFEGYNEIHEMTEARRALKYMCLCKVMLNEADTVSPLLNNKNTLKYKGEDINAMRALAAAFKSRSLKKFLQSFETYKKELEQDPLIKMQFQTLSETMIEKELTRLIEPYSIVDIDHLTRLIQLPKERVEKKLAQMILDQKIQGCIDQSSGSITLYEPENKNHAYESSVKLIHSLSKVVDASADRSGKSKSPKNTKNTTLSKSMFEKKLVRESLNSRAMSEQSVTPSEEEAPASPIAQGCTGSFRMYFDQSKPRCLECGRAIRPKKGDLQNHIGMHEEVICGCPHGCGKSYNSPKALFRHVKECHKKSLSPEERKQLVDPFVAMTAAKMFKYFPELERDHTTEHPSAVRRLFYISNVEDQDQLRRYKKIILDLNGEVDASENGEIDFSKEGFGSATHLITPSLGSVGVLAALARGLWVLTPQYLLDSQQAGHFLKENAYEYSEQIMNEPKENKVAAACRRWRLTLKENAALPNGAFSKWKALVYTRSPQAAKKFTELIRVGGGTTVVGPEHDLSVSLDGVTHVLVAHDVDMNAYMNDLPVFIESKIPCHPIAYSAHFLLDVLLNQRHHYDATFLSLIEIAQPLTLKRRNGGLILSSSDGVY